MATDPDNHHTRTPTQGAVRSVTLRSVLLGLAILPVNTVWVVLMERVDGRAFSSTASLFFTAVFFLVVLTAVNHLARAKAPWLALAQGELLTVYSMVCIGTAMAGVDFLEPLITLMGHAYWFATPSNHWENFWSSLPSWLTVHDRAALSGYYLGNSTLYRRETLAAWLPPIGWWTLFILALLWVMACINTALRAQWMERERLTFPITQLPLALTAEDAGLFRTRLFWSGLSLAAGLSLVNGIHFLYPAVPALTFNGYDAGQLFVARPWNAIGWTPLAVFPFIVGIGYLLPIDLLFSCWFFFLFWRLEKVAASALGYMADQPKFPYVDEQMLGGYLAVCVFALWAARHALTEVWQKALRAGPPAEAGEALPFRVAVFGGLAGILFLLGFALRAGVPLWLGCLFFLLYFAIAVSVTRMRAELGPPTHDLHFIGPDLTLYKAFGSSNLSAPTLGAFTIYYWFNRAYRCHPMPHQMEGLRMAQRSRIAPRGMLWAMLLAALAGIIAGFWVTLHVSYQLGAAARITAWGSLGYGNEAFTRLASWTASPSRPDTPAMSGVAVGFLIASGLMLMRMNVYGWPFHALGFAISGGWSMMWAWLSLFVAWVLKAIILRYGGMRGYHTGLPFFFGVIVGDFMVGGFWTLWGLIFHTPIYSLWSG